VLLGPAVGRATAKYKVAGWEEVAVPAGKFRALKIEGDGTYTRNDTRQTGRSKMELWYVPEVNRWVRFRFQTPTLDYGAELTGYRLNK